MSGSTTTSKKKAPSKPRTVKVPGKKARAGTRTDPEYRPTDGVAAWAQLLNKDPDRTYVLVNKGTPDMVANYLNIGYRIEIWEGMEGGEPAGVCPMSLHSLGHMGSGLDKGEQLIINGNFVMSVDNERKKQIFQEGAFGGSGQKRADEISRRMITKTAGDDPLRGIHRGVHNPYTDIEVGREHGRTDVVREG